MNKKDKLKEKIFQLNKAWLAIKNAIEILKKIFKNDNDIDKFIWKLETASNKMQSFIFKKIEKDYIDEEIDKMEKRLRDK